MLRNDDAAFPSSQCSYPLYVFLQVGKIKVTAKRLKILKNSLSEFRINNDKWDKKGQARGWIFSTKEFLIFVSSCWTVLQNTASSIQHSFPHSWQSINQYHSAWCTTYQDSTLYVSISLFLAKGRGKRTIENPSFSALIFSFFSKQGVLQCFIPQRVLFSRKKLRSVV